MNKKITKTILIIFMLIQPILDIYYLYTDKIINIFKLSPATIVRMIFLIYLTINTYLIYKDKIQKKYLISFIIIYLFYTIIHLLNATFFQVNFSNYQNYSTIRELFYLIRMIAPLILISITYYNKLEYKDIKKIVLIIYTIFSVTMIISNIFKIALTSYANGNQIIKDNFLSWFNGGYQKYGYEYLASKGIFHMANQISGVMTMLFPLLTYIILTDKFKIKNIIIISLSMFSMLMLGTRIASQGMLAVLIFSLTIYAFFNYLKNKKIMTKNVVAILTLLLITIAIYPYLPVNNRTYAEDNEQNITKMIKETKADLKLKYLQTEINQTNQITNQELLQEVSAIIEDKKIKFIEENYKIYGFDELYIKTLYPYTQDTDFWLELFNMPYAKRCNHRQLKTLITKRIIKLNNNKLDNITGLSFTRLRNALIYMENDIIVHFYSIGILGIILLILPYLYIGLYAIFKLIKNKKNFTYLNITYILIIFLSYLVGYLSGNIFDEWIVTLFLGLISGALINNLTKNN